MRKIQFQKAAVKRKSLRTATLEVHQWFNKVGTLQHYEKFKIIFCSLKCIEYLILSEDLICIPCFFLQQQKYRN